MNKIYQKPETNVVLVETQPLMDLSNPNNITFDNNRGGSISTQDDDAVSAGMSRGGSWDDED